MSKNLKEVLSFMANKKAEKSSFREETTFILIKPDGVKRGLVGEIIQRFEARGLKLVGLGMIWAKKAQVDRHYPKSKTWIKRLGDKTLKTYDQYKLDPLKELGTADSYKIGKMVRSWLITFMTSGPMVKMAVKGIHAVDMGRKLVGNTLPNLAEMGTIRGDYSVDSAAVANREQRAIHNLVHASETPQEAKHELDFWFSPDELHDYKRAEDELMF